MPNELVIASATDSQEIVNAAAGNDEAAARVTAPRPEVEKLDGSSVVSTEHPRSERAMLLERLAQHEADLQSLTSEADSEQVTSNETTEEEQPDEQEPDAEIMRAVREAAVSDAVQHAREKYAREQEQAHLAPVQIELNELRAQALVPFRARIEELKAGGDLKGDFNVLFPHAVLDVLVTLPGGPETTIYLAQHPEEARQLQSLPESIAVAKVAALTARLDPASRRKQSNAPAPIRPIGGSATKSSLPPDEMSFQDYKKFRDKEIAGRYRR